MRAFLVGAMEQALAHLGILIGHLGVIVLCLTGVVLSGLSFSGTWLVVLASLLGLWAGGEGFPGWKTVVVFVLISVVAEIMDTLAGSWGVRRRGGSNRAGWAALAGGIFGMLAGSLIPVPILGSLFGMFGGCFLAAYYAELSLQKEKEHAAHIARGAVIARVLIIALKLSLTLAMSMILIIGMIAG